MTMANRTAHTTMIGAMVVAGLGLLAGCGGETGGRGNGRDQPPGAQAGSDCVPANSTGPCTCDNGNPGRQICNGTVWGACVCAVPSSDSGSGGSGGAGSGGSGGMALGPADPGANDSPVRFDWERTEPANGSCEAGHYEGSFEGLYMAPLAFNAPIPVANVPGLPGGLVFDLEKEGSGEVFKVSNGKLSGLANGAFPFEADIVGSLDCSTKKFDAMLLNGSYIVGIFTYMFEGPITADYNLVTHTLVNGVWNVTEPMNPGSGGSGTWTVSWMP
jgi:hypothetical protein